MDTSKKVVPVGWFRVAVATQLMLEGMVVSLLVSILRAVALSLTEDPEVLETPLEVLNYAMYAYFAMGGVVLVYAALFAKPPTEANFTKTKWWMAWALMHRPHPMGRGGAVFDDDDGSPGQVNPSSAAYNPTTGNAMVGGSLYDAGGHNLGE